MRTNIFFIFFLLLKTNKKLMVELNNLDGLTFVLACLGAELSIEQYCDRDDS